MLVEIVVVRVCAGPVPLWRFVLLAARNSPSQKSGMLALTLSLERRARSQRLGRCWPGGLGRTKVFMPVGTMLSHAAASLADGQLPQVGAAFAAMLHVIVHHDVIGSGAGVDERRCGNGFGGEAWHRAQLGPAFGAAAPCLWATWLGYTQWNAHLWPAARGGACASPWRAWIDRRACKTCAPQQNVPRASQDAPQCCSRRPGPQSARCRGTNCSCARGTGHVLRPRPAGLNVRCTTPPETESVH